MNSERPHTQAPPPSATYCGAYYAPLSLQVLVIGGGVAGLSAIATARSLGAVVRAFDTRPAVKEQVRSRHLDAGCVGAL